MLVVVASVLVALVVGAAAGWYLRPRFTAPQPVARPTLAPVVSMAARSLVRCHTITYTYSDGSQQTYHRCQGHTEFTDAFGKSVAPSGTTLISARGGVHQEL